MKFITRQLYQDMQGADKEPSEWEAQNAKWKTAWNVYHNELSQIRQRLSPGMQTFAGLTFHDGVVRGVTQPQPSELVLDIDARRNPWGPIGIFRIRFSGVRLVEGIADLVGDEWLYEEVHLDLSGAFDYQILFWRSDFRIVAEEVAWEESPPAELPQ